LNNLSLIHKKPAVFLYRRFFYTPYAISSFRKKIVFFRHLKRIAEACSSLQDFLTNIKPQMSISLLSL